MAKYNYGLAGNSSHIHNSLWSADGKTPLFFDKNGEVDAVASSVQQWSAGQLKYAKEFTWFLAPYINSYKRFQAGTFAPTKIMWSGGQPYRRLPALRRGHQGRSAWNAASAAPTSTRISPLRR